MEQIDQIIFHFINDSLSNSLFDAMLPYCREKLLWIPLYTFVLAFALINFKKKALFLLLAVGLSVGISDFLSSEIIKKTVKRTRPCNDISFSPSVNLRIESCGSGYSFTSSHATNHFAVAMVFAFFFTPFRPRWTKYFFIWAALVSFSQIYVGVHYPFDIIAGALLGCTIGGIISLFILKE